MNQAVAIGTLVLISSLIMIPNVPTATGDETPEVWEVGVEWVEE